MTKLIIFLAVQVLFVVAMVVYKKQYSNTKLALLATLFFYLSIVAVAFISGYIIESHLESFDLDGDGSFSQIEKTAKQQKAMQAAISDNARNFAPIFGILYSIVYFVLLRLILIVRKPKQLSVSITETQI